MYQKDAGRAAESARRLEPSDRTHGGFAWTTEWRSSSVRSRRAGWPGCRSSWSARSCTGRVALGPGRAVADGRRAASAASDLVERRRGRGPRPAPSATEPVARARVEPIIVHLEESAEPEDVNDNAGADAGDQVDSRRRPRRRHRTGRLPGQTSSRTGEASGAAPQVRCARVRRAQPASQPGREYRYLERTFEFGVGDGAALRLP